MNIQIHDVIHAYLRSFFLCVILRTFLEEAITEGTAGGAQRLAAHRG